jgi:perosamine synthetase
MLQLYKPRLGGNEWNYLKECVDTNWLSGGPFVTKFEELCMKFLDAPHAVAVANGTSGLHVALRALGIGPGDEVIVPTLTFIASANPIVYVGATPVFADCEDETWNMDSSRLEALITPKTKAIVVVHLYGHPVDMDPVLALAKKHGLKIVEDATESLGSKYKGRFTGLLGDIGVLSFNGNKLITCGNGGLIITRDDALAKHARYLINQARDDAFEYEHGEVGYNYRLTNLQAALGAAQFEQLPDFLGWKKRNAQLYRSLLKDVPGVEFSPHASWAEPNEWMHSVLLTNEIPSKRKALIAAFEANQIQCRPFFKPMHTLKPFRSYVKPGQTLAVAERLYSGGINVPSSVDLTEEEIRKVVKVILSVTEKS